MTLTFKNQQEDLDSVSFGQLLYTLTKGLSPKELLDMSDSEMVRHIQKLQIKETRVKMEIKDKAQSIFDEK